MEVPPVQYVRREGANLAVQVGGRGVDVVLGVGSECMSATYEDPEAAGFLFRFHRFARLITFDQRGSGLSDPLTHGPLPLEERVADLLAVCEAVGAARPFLVGTHDGGPVALLAVTTHPERFAGLVMINTAARMAAAPDYPEGMDEVGQAAWLDAVGERWGTGFSVGALAASWAARAGGRERWARLERYASSPAQAVLQSRQAFETDARDLLGLVSVPTLIIHRRDDPAVPAGSGRYLADRIPGATLLELAGEDHMAFVGDHRQIVDAVQSFAGANPDDLDRGDRRVAAVVFTDIVGSTQLATQLGDSRWVQLLDAHDQIARRLASEHDGRWVKSTGDGSLAVFAGPARAIAYAASFRSEVRHLGLPVRSGVHAGEVEARGEDIAGIAVHIAARVTDLAGEDETVVSRTVVDLTAGSGIAYAALGEVELRGVADCVEVFRVTAT